MSPDTCRHCGADTFLDWCEACSRRAANDPAFAATRAGQDALHAAARICAMQRRAALRPTDAPGRTQRATAHSDTANRERSHQAAPIAAIEAAQ